MTKTKWSRVIVKVVVVAMAALLGAVPAAAHQSPVGCSQNRLGVDIGPQPSTILNGDKTCWHPSIFNNPFSLSDACLIDTTTVTLTCPAADGTSTGTVLTLGTNLSLPVNGSGNVDFGMVCCPTVTFNPGVTSAFARVDAGKQGDTTKGKFHQAAIDLSFQIFKEAVVTVLTCTVEVDKQVSCVGAPFIDVGFTTNDGDGTSQRCDAWNAFPGMSAEPVTVRYVARNTGIAGGPDLTNCSITESNTAITNAPVAVPDLVAGGPDSTPIDITKPCSDTLSAGEPNRADLTCSCTLNGFTQMATAFDRANFRCLTPGLNIDKMCTTVAGGSPSPFTITVSNSGTADLAGCVVDDKFSAPGDDMCAGALTEASGFPTAPFDLASGAPAHQIMGSLGPLGAGDTCNRASVQCNIVGSSKTISNSKDAICSVTTTTTTTTTTSTTTSTTTTTTTTTVATTTTTSLCPMGPGAGFAFLFLSEGRVGERSTIQANIGANPPGGLLQLGRDSTVTPNNVAAGDTVRLGSGVSVFELLVNVFLHGPGVVVGTQGTPTLPLTGTLTPCPVGPFDCTGGPGVFVPAAQSQTISPMAGPYGQLVLGNHATLMLQPGDYTFCSINASRGSTITILGPGQTTINVVGNVRVADAARLAPAPGAPTPFLNSTGTLFRLGAGAFVQAFIKAPNAQLATGRRSTIKGTFCVFSSRSSDKGIMLMCPPPNP